MLSDTCFLLHLLVAGAALADGPVLINEIHYAPSDPTAGEEFVELHNPGLVSVDLSGWSFTEAISFTLPQGTALGPGGYLAVAQNPAALRARFGDVPVVGPFTGRLSNDGERIVLRDRLGALADAVDYRRGFPWPTVGGHPSCSIERGHPSAAHNP